MTNQCNAIWNGIDIVTYVSSASCANFGELACVLIHEFTHGLDDNGSAVGVTFPSEGVADAMAALETNLSCPARGAFPGSQCPGFDDVCQDCDGALDVDGARHLSGVPHDLPLRLGEGAAFQFHSPVPNLQLRRPVNQIHR